jgi:hypothetical protein
MIPSGLVVGYHGCDRGLAEDVVLRRAVLRPSENEHDWLGHGLYFWQNDPDRAMAWAKQRVRVRGSGISEPAVIGATIDLGHCFNAAQSEYVAMLGDAFAELEKGYAQSGRPMPANAGRGWANRKLDCAVFEVMHLLRRDSGEKPFDTVVAYFPEGKAPFPGAVIRHHDHVQICVRNEACIVGYFLPRGVGVDS